MMPENSGYFIAAYVVVAVVLGVYVLSLASRARSVRSRARRTPTPPGT